MNLGITLDGHLTFICSSAPHGPVNPSVKEVEAGRFPWIEGQSGLYIKLLTSQGFIGRSVSNKQKHKIRIVTPSADCLSWCEMAQRHNLVQCAQATLYRTVGVISQCSIANVCPFFLSLHWNYSVDGSDKLSNLSNCSIHVLTCTHTLLCGSHY